MGTFVIYVSFSILINFTYKLEFITLASTMKTSLQCIESLFFVRMLNVIQSLDLFMHAASVPSAVVVKPKPVTYGGVTADEFYEVIQDIMYHFVYFVCFTFDFKLMIFFLKNGPQNNFSV